MPEDPDSAPADGLVELPPIVVVDDDTATRLLLERYLGHAGLRNPVITFPNGDEAVARLPDLAPPALVLLDLIMPGRDGLEVLRWIRERSALAAVPVLMLTGNAELSEVDAAYELGIDAYLVKPVGIEALGDVVRRIAAPWALLARPPGAGS